MIRSVQAFRLKGLQCFCAITIWTAASGVCFAADKFPVPEARAEQAKNAVKATLKDPESAQFRNLYTKSFTGNPPRPNLAALVSVCGEVNAKNSYGGYTGFTRFYQVAPGDAPVKWGAEDWENSSFGFVCD
ncbi:hypothetical protein QN391_07325 [Pseudomonas sp. CCI1.2]|uniref:hypothetical protein n=1 Tax=unclassified Pseudomonas TaxID=196821 RepID=UPI002AC9CDF3|nr:MULTISPECIES: hypothetical protein [unclassified Pseudomonas]MEB0092879.1 hypothetical protein [Pseudomonas sp. CCI4.2]MEB0120517.1 hypothetical protein [Pseudomonas sp. CCI1.2]WPX55468.1 hypothetical protein RHM65_07875 [Pseudomonas sp. CCI4.2]